MVISFQFSKLRIFGEKKKTLAAVSPEEFDKSIINEQPTDDSASTSDNKEYVGIDDVE